MTLPFDGEAVRRALALFEGAASPEEGARLASLVGSWEELLAHLALQRGSLPADIAAAVLAACDTTGGPASPRSQGPDIGRLRSTEEALEAAIARLLQGEAELRAAADAATAAFGAHAAERPGSGRDLYLRIAPGGR